MLIRRTREYKDGDAVICFNFRTDRCREITEVLTQTAFPDYQMKPLQLHYTTMTMYDHTFKNIHVIFENDDLKNTLGEILSQITKNKYALQKLKNIHTLLFFLVEGVKFLLKEKAGL